MARPGLRKLAQLSPNNYDATGFAGDDLKAGAGRHVAGVVRFSASKIKNPGNPTDPPPDKVLSKPEKRIVPKKSTGRP